MTIFDTTQIDTPEPPLVLVTDDNRQARMLLRRILEREGFRVEEAADGPEAMEKLADHQPDLILMDVQMGEMDGFETVQHVRSDPRTARTPIIVVTAAAREPADIARGFGLGADDYLLKPFNAAELVARANSKIRARRLEDKLQQRNIELEALVQVGIGMNQQLDINEIADHLMEAVENIFQAEHIALLILDAQGQPALLRQHGLAHVTLEALLAPGTLPEYVLSRLESVSVSKLQAAQHIRVIFPETACVDGIAAPFVHHGQALGMLAIGGAKEGRFTSGNFRVLRSIAEQTALAIRNAQLFAALEAYAENLESMVEARTKALQQAQAQLVRADKLAAIGTLAAGISHEVNTPLQAIMTALEMALEDIDADRPVERPNLELARHEVYRLKQLVRRVLAFARPDSGSFTPNDLGEIMRDVLSLVRKQLEHSRVTQKVNLRPTEPFSGNADQIKQVILNLVVNAMEAMPQGGVLEMQTAQVNGFATLSVQDTGIGIPQEALQRIFDPFFTTKSEGTGLGLAVSHSIIEGHGGRIEVESEPGKGTRFTLYLPSISS